MHGSWKAGLGCVTNRGPGGDPGRGCGRWRVLALLRGAHMLSRGPWRDWGRGASIPPPPATGSPSRQPLLITAYARALMNAVVSWATEPHPRECGPSSPSVYCLVQKTGHV